MEAAIAAAIILLLLFLAWWFFLRNPQSVTGTIAGGGTASRPVDKWQIAPAQIQVGVPATFQFESMNNNPGAINTPQLTPISGRAVGFTVTPAEVQILSIDGVAVNGAAGSGATAASGWINVVIQASAVPAPAEGEEIPQGAIVGIAVASPGTPHTATFTIVP